MPGALEPQKQKDHLALSGLGKEKGAKRLMSQERRRLCDWQMWVEARLVIHSPGEPCAPRVCTSCSDLIWGEIPLSIKTHFCGQLQIGSEKIWP